MEEILGFSLGKQHRLKSRKIIKLLFSEGSSIFIYPLKLIYLKGDINEELPKVLFSVSKKNFKSSVDRHKIIRLLRESYRIERKVLNSAHHVNFLAIIYVSKELLAFSSIQKKLILALERLNDTFESSLSPTIKDPQ